MARASHHWDVYAHRLNRRSAAKLIIATRGHLHKLFMDRLTGRVLSAISSMKVRQLAARARDAGADPIISQFSDLHVSF
jgi:hypothetical protein